MILNRLQLYKSISRQYLEIQKKIKKNHKIVESIKLYVIISFLVISIFAYLFYVNAASTKGYFYKSENTNLDKARFNYNVMLLDILKLEKNLWDSVDANVNINTKIFSGLSGKVITIVEPGN